ncbi:hypothetical protein P692DRAFT_20742858 [Suillus brevipes Sb2]|nr:hypothetical protein P692DRAFT_20742858 [Suillus brevipes Sb2]
MSEGFEKYAEWSKEEFCKFYIFGDWFRLLNNHVLDPTNDDDSSDEDSEVGKDAIPEIILDEHGFATLPSRKEVSLKGQQELVRQIFYASYSDNPLVYLDPDSIPDGFVVQDPSHLKAQEINNLWRHWEARKALKQKLVIFVGANTRPQIQDNSEDSSDDNLPPSTGQVTRPSLAQEGVRTPATVPVKDRMSFLQSLSSNNEYVLFISCLGDLKQGQSSEATEWPAWATWSWDESHLPNSVHSDDSELNKFLEMVVSAKISGVVSAMKVGLGLGMLLRECKRVIEYEEDEATPNTPSYLGTSILSIKTYDLVIEAINTARGGNEKDSGGKDDMEDKEQHGEEEEAEEEEEEVVVQKGKKRGKSGGSGRPSKKVTTDIIRRSGRSRQPSKKAMRK